MVLMLGALPSPVFAQDTHLLVVVGLGGDDRYRERFHGWATRMLDAAGAAGVPDDRMRYLGERPEMAPDLIHDRSTRENIEGAIRDMADAAAPGDVALIVLIGHGTARDGQARINLPGPDLGPAEFALLLDQLSALKVAFVNTASSSGGFVDRLAGPDRTVMTATRSAREQNETVFAGHFVAAFSGDTADLDKDGRVSLLEAFEYATHEVERYYADEGLLQTEHARLVDDWRGDGDEVTSTDVADASLARSMFLAGGMRAATVADASPELTRLYQRRDSLEIRVEELRGVRETMESEEYERRLEDLLVELGLLAREIRDMEGRP
jgi:hypothetical protein